MQMQEIEAGWWTWTSRLEANLGLIQEQWDSDDHDEEEIFIFTEFIGIYTIVLAAALRSIGSL